MKPNHLKSHHYMGVRVITEREDVGGVYMSGILMWVISYVFFVISIHFFLTLSILTTVAVILSFLWGLYLLLLIDFIVYNNLRRRLVKEVLGR